MEVKIKGTKQRNDEGKLDEEAEEGEEEGRVEDNNKGGEIKKKKSVLID